MNDCIQWEAGPRGRRGRTKRRLPRTTFPFEAHGEVEVLRRRPFWLKSTRLPLVTLLYVALSRPVQTTFLDFLDRFFYIDRGSRRFSLTFYRPDDVARVRFHSESRQRSYVEEFFTHPIPPPGHVSANR